MDWVEQEIRSTRGKRAIELFAQMIINNNVDYKILGNVYRSDQKIPEATIKRLIKQEKFSSAVNNKIVEILAGKGINEQFLADKRLGAIDLAEKLEKPDIMLKGIEGFEDMLEMKPKTVKHINSVRETRQLSVSNDINKALEATQSIEYKEETDSNNDNNSTKQPTEDNSDTTNSDTDNE